MQTGASSKGGGLFSQASAWGLTLIGALEIVAGGHAAASLGLEAVLGLNLLVGTALFLFSVALSSLTLGVCVQLRGPILAVGGLGYWANFPSTSRNVLIFLTIVGWGQSLVLHEVHFINCVVLSLQKICIPCIEVIFTSTSTISTGSPHLKYPCRKITF